MSEHRLFMAVDLRRAAKFKTPDELRPATPEERLLHAVLARACMDVHLSVPREEQRKAIQWFQSKEDHDFSFKWICCELDLDEQAIRAAILSPRMWTKKLHL